MNYKAGEIEFLRLKSLLVSDKVNTPTQFSDVIKSDVYGILNNYMELTPDDLDVKIDADENGFRVVMTARTNRFRQIGTLPKAYKT